MNERSIFQEALEKATPVARAAFVETACAGDEGLRRRVEALLREYDGAGDFLERPVIASDTTDLPTIVEGSGSFVGPYKLLQRIGEGGFGVVYMAEQEQPVRRRIALKIVKPGMDSAQVVARFEAERQALAMMDHQNIARVFDAGTTKHGRPYFVMELVHGISITKYCDENHLTTRERLELFVPVCQAIQHAHQKGIIHRDIKPSNVLVTLYDGRPVPKVIDFGVAKAIEQRLTDRTVFTNYGTVVGTFEYMAPEQAEMSALGVDTRSDIYSLGVLLYELLTGTTPLERKRISDAGYADVLKMIKEEEPLRPSNRISTSGSLPALAAARKTDPGKLVGLVRGELDWIVMKCLEKDRARRYETANGLARDLQRFLNDEPVEACPPSTWYKLRKFARKHRAVFAVCAGFLLLLAGAAVTASWLAVRARLAEAEAVREREATERALAKARAIGDFLSHDLLGRAAPEFSPHQSKVTVEELLVLAAQKIDREPTFTDQPEVEAALRHVIGYTLFKVGAQPDGVPHLRRAVKLRRDAIGPEHPDTLSAQEDLAYVLMITGELSEAEDLARRTYDARRKVLGPEHADTFDSLDTLASVYTELGRHDQANVAREQCLVGRRRFGESDRGYMLTLGNYGYDLIEQGRHDESLAALREAARLRLAAICPKDPELLSLRNNIGLCLYYLGRGDESVQTARDALALGRELMGPRKWQTLHLQHTLARALYLAGQLDEADRLARETIATRREVLGPGNIHVGRTLVVSGLILMAMEKPDAAEAAFRDALAVFRNKTNADDWIAQAECGLGAIQIARGQRKEGEPLVVGGWPKLEPHRRVAAWQKRNVCEFIAAAYEKAGVTMEANAWRATAAKLAPAPQGKK